MFHTADNWIAKAASLFDRSGRTSSLTEYLLVDLARRRPRNWAENDGLGGLEVGEPGAAMLDQLGRSRLRPRLELDEGAGRLAPFRIGLRHHCRGEHRWMIVKRVFHFK